MEEKKEFKPRKRSTRNKLVTFLLGVPSIVMAAEAVFPGKIPPGTGTLLIQIGAALGLGANVLVKK